MNIVASKSGDFAERGIHAEIYRYVSRFQKGLDPNNRPRLFQLYAYYKKWAIIQNDEDFQWVSDAQHNYMIENYVNRIASTIRELDDYKYPLSHYLAYGWDGLTKYGYTAKRLTKEENKENQRLRGIVDSKTLICK